MNHKWTWNSIAATSAPLAPSGHLLGDVATKIKSTTDGHCLPERWPGINTDKEKLFLKNEELSPCLPVSVSIRVHPPATL